MAILACACPEILGTLLVPQMDDLEVRKSGAPAASLTYRWAGASCRCKPQLVGYTYLSSVLGDVEAVLSSPILRKGS